MTKLQKKKKKIYIYALLAWTLSILAIAFRILSQLFSYDEEIGYFNSDKPFPLLYHICLVLIAVLAFSALFTFRKTKLSDKVLNDMKHPCIMEKVAALIGALCMLIVTVANILIYWISEQLEPNAFTVFGIITCVFSIFFFLFFGTPSHHGKSLHIFSGFAFVLHYVYMLGVSYFELDTPLNNPVKILFQLTAIAAIFYLLSDLRFYMDIARPTRYVASSIFFLSFSAISILTGGFFSVPSEGYTHIYHLYNVVNTALLIFAVVRVMRMLALWTQIYNEHHHFQRLRSKLTAISENTAEELETANPESTSEASEKEPQESACDSASETASEDTDRQG